MAATYLFKYLDANGGLMMLQHGTLMFTNATQLNDPFDCHPAYRHLYGANPEAYKGLPVEVVSWLEYNKGLSRREKTYICSLTKVHNSILMWSYYSNRSGVCIGLDMEKTRQYLNQMVGTFLGCHELDVIYRDVIHDPVPLSAPNDFLRYHFATKAKEWQHEQEVRLIAYDPSPMHMRLLPGQYEEESFSKKFMRIFQKKKEDTYMDWKEVRAFLDIGGECFESVYLGIKLNEKKNAKTRERIIKVARECNPNIKLYQMTIDPEAFRLREKQIE